MALALTPTGKVQNLCGGFRFRPCYGPRIVSALLGHLQRCSFSTGRLQRPPVNPGVEWGRRLAVHACSSHGCRCPRLGDQSIDRVKGYPDCLQSAAWFVVKGGFPSGCGHRCWAPGLVSRSSPPHVQRGCCAHSSWPRLLSWASPSLSAVCPLSLRLLPSGVAVGFWLPIIPDFPAVAVGLSPVGSGTSSDAGDCLLSPTPPQLRGRVLMSSTSPGPTLVLAGARFMMSKSGAGSARRSVRSNAHTVPTLVNAETYSV